MFAVQHPPMPNFLKIPIHTQMGRVEAHPNLEFSFLDTSKWIQTEINNPPTHK